MGLIFDTWKGLHWMMKTLAILIVLFLAYVAFGFFAVPPIAESVLSNTLGKALSRRVVVEEVTFNPLTLRARVQGVAVYGTDNSTVDLSLGVLDVDVQAASVVRGALVLKRILIGAPEVFVHVQDPSGRTNLTDMFARSGETTSEPAEEAEESGLFPVIIEDFACVNGSLRVQDDPRSVSHVVDKIELIIPRFSTHEKDLETKILPHLAFRLNGTSFEIQGSSVPFSSPRRTEFELNGLGLDLTDFWSYVPIGPHLTLISGRATTNASLVVEESTTGDLPLSLFLAGKFILDDAELTHRQDGRILACKQLVAELERFRLLGLETAFSRIHLQNPLVVLTREEESGINWNRYIQEITGKNTEDSGNPEAATAPLTSQPAMRISAASITLDNGRVEFEDTVVEPGFETSISPLHVAITDFDTQEGAVSRVRADTTTSTGETLSIASNVILSPFSCNGTCTLTNATIPTYAPYYASLLPLELTHGVVELTSGFEVAVGNATDLRFNDLQVQVDGLELRKPGSQESSLGFEIFSLAGGDINVSEQRIAVANATLTSPAVALERDRQGNIDLVSLFAGDSTNQNKDSESSNSTGNSSPWMVQVDHVRCADGQFVFTDRTVMPVAVNRITDLDLDLANVGTDLGSRVDFNLGALVNESGKVNLQGDVIPETMLAKGQLKVADLGLSPVTSYLPEAVKIDIAGGTLNIAGNWELTTKNEVGGVFQGDVRMVDFLLRESGNQRPLADFDSLELTGIDMGLASRLLQVDRIVLSHPRLVLAKDEQGVLNLARALSAESGNEQGDPGSPAAKPSASAESAEGSPATTQSHPYFFKDIDIDGVRIVQGKVGFHDHSLSPDFTADLTKINLDLSHVSLDPSKSAALDLNATLNDHAPISLTGKVSPLRRPVSSNLVFNLAHMDMTGLTPYTIKSLAYPVVQGKLNWNGKFITEDYVLEATNTFFVQQFQLGEKVDSSDAVSVPIKLGLALLQDGNGDLTLDVPIRGRLDDPQFRLGGVIFKAIIGIFSKIATAPFALIGSMFGGGEDLSHLDFAPGHFRLDPAGENKLDTVVTALTKRPKLRVFVSGLADPAADRSTLENQAFLRRLKVQKYNDDKDAFENVDEVTIAEGEYEEWLFEAYKETPGDKPRRFNMVVKPSLEEMEQAVRQQVSVQEDDLLELANQRARGVQQYLLETGQIAANRVFVTSPKLIEQADDQSGMRVELSLSQ
jgi:uncharacterized protein involved in outer membrane biogenesis